MIARWWRRILSWFKRNESESKNLTVIIETENDSRSDSNCGVDYCYNNFY